MIFYFLINYLFQIIIFLQNKKRIFIKVQAIKFYWCLFLKAYKEKNYTFIK